MEAIIHTQWHFILRSRRDIANSRLGSDKVCSWDAWGAIVRTRLKRKVPGGKANLYSERNSFNDLFILWWRAISIFIHPFSGACSTVRTRLMGTFTDSVTWPNSDLALRLVVVYILPLRSTPSFDPDRAQTAPFRSFEMSGAQFYFHLQHKSTLITIGHWPNACHT